MLNIGSGEFLLIAVVALLILGPSRLPELARGVGKFVREFRRQTDDVRGVVEREFYKMDEAVNADLAPVALPPPGAEPSQVLAPLGAETRPTEPDVPTSEGAASSADVAPVPPPTGSESSEPKS